MLTILDIPAKKWQVSGNRCDAVANLNPGACVEMLYTIFEEWRIRHETWSFHLTFQILEQRRSPACHLCSDQRSLQAVLGSGSNIEFPSRGAVHCSTKNREMVDFVWFQNNELRWICKHGANQRAFHWHGCRVLWRKPAGGLWCVLFLELHWGPRISAVLHNTRPKTVWKPNSPEWSC